MKVLMFGWEFPPHISGGLGTACEGLTHALIREDVKLTFVVPKLFGNEDQSCFTILSASKVPVRLPAIPSDAEEELIKAVSGNLLGKERNIRHQVVRDHGSEMKMFEIESLLLPYSFPSLSEPQYSVEQWNYELGEVYRSVQVLKNETESEKIQARGTKVKANRYKVHKFSGTYGPNLFGETLSYAEVAMEIANHEAHDIIHAHDWITFPAGVAASKVSGKKLVLHVHATEIDRSGATPDPVVFEIEKQGLQQADHIVAVSEWTRQIIVKYYAVSPQKISVVHNGVVAKEHEALAAGKKLGAHYVTFLGRITFQKGPMYFVQAAVKVVRRFPDTHFIVAGSGDMMPKMIELVAKLNLSSNFHFTGFLKGKDINRVWALTDLYVMPSVSEPFGITPLEASRSGVPVIVSNQSGVAEVMSHTIKIDFWNVDELANAICSVLAYPSLAKSLSENGKNEIQEITWQKAAKKLKDIYEKQITK